jgi:2,4-dienoyl-CoA reductase-like NADH-dependent reductase (Old Yellow Enzyme family)
VTDATASYRHLFSPLRIRNTTLPNRVIFGPVCPTWVRSPHEGIFTEQAVAYYEERAKTGLGMIRSSRGSPTLRGW